MKLRPNHIVIAVIVALGAVVGYAYFSTRGPGGGKPGGSEDDFLAQVREQAEDAPRGQEVGWEMGATEGGLDRAPRAEFETTEFDMGVIPHDRPTQRTLMVRNTGTADLVIGNIQTQCHCTEGDMKRKVIPAGEQEPLLVTVYPSRIPRFKSTKVLSIGTSDPRNPLVRVSVTAKVDPEFHVDPEEFDFGKVPQGQTATTRLLFRQAGADPAELLGVEPYKNAKGIAATFVKRPESEWAEPGKPEYFIDVTFNANEAFAGPAKGHLTIKTNTPRLPEFFCTYTAEVVGADGQALGLAGQPVEPVVGPPALEEFEKDRTAQEPQGATSAAVSPRT